MTICVLAGKFGLTRPINEQQQNRGERGEGKCLICIQVQNKFIRIAILHSTMLKRLIIVTA